MLLMICEYVERLKRLDKRTAAMVGFRQGYQNIGSPKISKGLDWFQLRLRPFTSLITSKLIFNDNFILRTQPFLFQFSL
jgi:hypothetical protein